MKSRTAEKMERIAKPVTIATLGPKGTFSHQAALTYSPKAKLLFVKTVRDVFEAVQDRKASYGIVPLENSLSGTIGQTLDWLLSFPPGICAEIVVPVQHHLVGKGTLRSIKAVFVQPQAYEQCESFFRRKLRHASPQFTGSNADSAKAVVKNDGKGYAAVVSKLALRLYSLPLIEKDIQDNANNVTRFAVIGNEHPRPTAKDRTSVAIIPKGDRPGLLFELLGYFAKRSLNLTRIESRPSKGKLGEYVFYIDFEGHQDSPIVQDLFEVIRKHFVLKVVGSYPRVY